MESLDSSPNYMKATSSFDAKIEHSPMLMEVSEDVNVTRPTYSSTLKNSNFPKPVELHSGGAKSEKNPRVKISKRFLYRRRRSLKKQKSIIPKIESGPGGEERSSDKKKNIQKSQIIPVVEPLNSYEEICHKPDVELFGNGYENIQQLDFMVNNKVAQVNESDKYSPTREVSKLQFRKQRHISMWHLIHEHMSMDLVAKRPNEPLEGTDDESPMEDENLELDTMSIDSERREIDLRKMFSIKLVREAIEKILLPEVQDQASDDQSVTSESTPRTEVFESNLTREFNQAEPDIDQEASNLSYIPKDGRLINVYTSSQEIMQNEKDVVRKSEKNAPKHWSNLKKWILLQRFIRELEKVKKFNPKKPQLLPLVPDPEAEKVNLRPRTLDGRKSAEEWMLDYAIRRAVGQLAPTQKRKVALLVKAFETVAPNLKKEDDPQVQYRIPRLESHGKNNGAENREIGSIMTNKKTEKLCLLNDDPSERIWEVTSTEKFACKDLKGQKDLNIGLRSLYSDGDFIPSNGNIMLEDPDSKKGKLEMITADEREATPKPQDFQENALCDPIKESSSCTQMDKNNHIKMWHMIYQHVVSGIAEKVGSRLLDGAENDEVEDKFSPDGGYPDDFSQSTNCSSGKNHVSNRFTKSDALKLVKEAVDEILLPEMQDDSSDTQSVTSESISGIDIESEVPKAKNWGKLRRLILLKRSIKALEKARKVAPQPNHLYSQAADHVPEKIELRHQMMGEKKKAEEWMLDYAVRHIVTKLTPARKRRVSMLVEAFEAVVPLPEM
ncbi:hypothetical protein OROGR_006619 [Orobanche gracilis]